MLQCMIRLSHHLWWQLCTSRSFLIRLESPPIALLVGVLLVWSRLGLAKLYPVILNLVLVHIAARCAWYIPVASSTHGSLVHHQLNVLPLRVKPSVNERLGRVVVRSVIALGEELSDVLGRWRASEE